MTPGVRMTVQWSVAIQKLTTRPRAGPGDRGLVDAAPSDPRGDAQGSRVSQPEARALVPILQFLHEQVVNNTSVHVG